jgi:acetyl-CoA carboxylase biotin carboxyl carrier protein
MDLERLAALLELLNEHEVSEFNFSNETMGLELRLGAQVIAAPAMMAAVPAAAPVAAAPAAGAPASDEDSGLVVVEAPMVGTFYRSPSPDAASFIEVGSSVSVGDSMCIIEAMKLMNEIEAEFAGVVVEILVENAQVVQFGQALFKIRPV